MLLVIFVSLYVSLARGKVIDGEYTLVQGEETLIWPDKYTVKATKMSLKSDLVEDFVFWQSNQTTRLDSNNGVVKVLSIEESEWGDVIKYEIRPETVRSEKIEYKCYNINDEVKVLKLTSDDVLPDLSDNKFIAVANESVFGVNTVKFEYQEKYKGTHLVDTLWAANDYDIGDGLTIWRPIRYEQKEYNIKLGGLTVHIVWEFSEFNIDFDEFKVIDDVITEYGCDEEKLIKITPNSDAVLKELMFIDVGKKHHVDHVYNGFKERFNRKYAHEVEHNLRKNIFEQNMRLISSINRKHLGYKLAINQFADRTPEETKKMTGLKKRPEGKTGNIPYPYTETKLKSIVDELPTNVDLRLDGLVTPVHDQESCGSCWTFGTTSAVEGALARSNGGRLMRLSNQALIDCAWGYVTRQAFVKVDPLSFGGDGCDGGTDNAAYEWMMKYGLPTEEQYGPYKNQDGLCHITKNMTLFPIKGYTNVTPFSNIALKVALFKHGPLSVSVEATKQFTAYSSGIFYEYGCGTDLDHEVTLVGYGEQYGELFWILKNSWGVEWGIDGYMLISARDNNCGVATEPTYVVL